MASSSAMASKFIVNGGGCGGGDDNDGRFIGNLTHGANVNRPVSCH
jgi:hypothetical protein